MTTINASIENIIVIKLDNTRESGKIYLGKYTFFIKDAPPRIELIAILVDSAKSRKLIVLQEDIPDNLEYQSETYEKIQSS